MMQDNGSYFDTGDSGADYVPARFVMAEDFIREALC